MNVWISTPATLSMCTIQYRYAINCTHTQWRFPKMGVPPNHPFSWDFPWNNSSSYWCPILQELEAKDEQFVRCRGSQGTMLMGGDGAECGSSSHFSYWSRYQNVPNCCFLLKNSWKTHAWNHEYRWIERGDPRKYEYMGRWVGHGKTQVDLRKLKPDVLGCWRFWYWPICWWPRLGNVHPDWCW